MLFSQLTNMQIVDDFEVKNICKTCESATEGSVFFCFTDEETKAYKRAQTAIENGARAVLSQFDLNLPGCFCVENVREEFAYACKKFYGNACDKLKIVGVTGTNGKTTTAHIIAEILKRNGKSVGVIGTNGVFYGGHAYSCPLTTPDADFLHKTFSQMLAAGVEYVIMEVSAHAIDQHRIDGIMFDVGVLTNITQDHLDYFETMEKYAKVKASFLTSKHVRSAIVCVDDKLAYNMTLNCDVPKTTYGIDNPADTFAIDIISDINGSHFVANVCDSVMELKTNLIGKHNIYNSLGALSVCKKLGLTDRELSDGINFINPAEGRFNIFSVGGVYAVIDFAHTPDGLENVLKTARNLTDKKVFVVFGCGGERDAIKREKMGKIAEEYADVVCLTNDNPRSENPEKIVHDIEKNMKTKHFVEFDRAKAIKDMLHIAHDGDIVVIAGKGAEKTQEIGDKKIAYSDFDVIIDFYQENKMSSRREK
ncbi:MAG: UDP-N-acetylmuramoyl-L-alanyl-D-glutamate--2,6-diaminopimelate ligase [Clostridia bacterium]|nr:UDP-N-acetylmuramoyl-L-alanyl-D-glutamate--2,6-diaminopimelate ligase [Clostridia bacterium]